MLTTAAAVGSLHLGSLLAAIDLRCTAEGSDGGLAGLERRLRMQVTFHNPMPLELRNQRFWCYLPMTDLGQMLSDVSVTIDHQVSMDSWGHRVLSLRFERFPAYGSQTVGISFIVRNSDKICARVHEEPNRWMQPGSFIESDAPQVRTLGMRLRRSTDLETQLAIFQWVKQELSYEGYVPQDRGALYALLTKSGDCTEFAALVVALSRACGIPARMLGGYVVDRDTLLRAIDYHNWAEVLLDGRWFIVDAQKGQWMPPRRQYIPFEVYHDEVANEMGLSHRYKLSGDIEVRI